MKSLLEEYKVTLQKTKKHLKIIEKQLLPLKEIIHNPEEFQEWREAARLKAEPLRMDKEILSGIESDLEFIIEWLSTGRQPGTKNGVDHLAAYQKEKPFDPYLMQIYAQTKQDVYEWEDPEEEQDIHKERLSNQILSVLSEKEKEIFILSSNGLSQYEIADTLHIPRTTIMNCLKRSREKIMEEGWII